MGTKDLCYLQYVVQCSTYRPASSISIEHLEGHTYSEISDSENVELDLSRGVFGYKLVEKWIAKPQKMSKKLVSFEASILELLTKKKISLMGVFVKITPSQFPQPTCY